MSLAVVALIVFVLLAVALIPAKPKQMSLSGQQAPPVVGRSLRQQHVDEEALAISSEYRRLADEAWLAELRQKASASLSKSTAAGK